MATFGELKVWRLTPELGESTRCHVQAPARACSASGSPPEVPGSFPEGRRWLPDGRERGGRGRGAAKGHCTAHAATRIMIQ